MFGKGDPQRSAREEVTVPMAKTPAFVSVTEAAEMVLAGLGFLAAADATAMAADTQAHCLQVLEQTHSISTAARTSVLAAFTAGQDTARMRITARGRG